MAIITAGSHSLTAAKYIASRALGPAVARNVASMLINTYSLEGKNASAIDLSRFSDIGTADSIGFGVEYTGEAAFGSTAVTLTPTRKAKGGTIDKDTYLRRVPGYSAQDVANALNSLAGVMAGPGESDPQAMMIEAAFGQEIRQAFGSLFETLEIDVVALFAGFSNNVGTTTANMTVSIFEDALATIEGASSLPHEDIVACLDPRQVYDLRADLRGSNNSGAMSTDLASVLAFSPGIPTNGWRGNLLGVNIYQHGPEARVTANAAADVVGAMFLRGEGDPEDSGAGKPGALAMAQGHGPQITGEVKANTFGARIVVDWPNVAGERVDNWGCAITTDAP